MAEALSESINDRLAPGGLNSVAVVSTVGGVTSLVGPDGENIGITRPGNSIAIIGNSIVSQCLPYSTTTTRWLPGTAKSVSDAILPSTYTGMVYGIKYVCTVGGTTAASLADEPTWPTTIGGTVTDGTVTWEAQADGDTYHGHVGDWWFWSQARSGQRLREALIVGASGAKWPAIATLKDRVIASGAGVVFLPTVFANDIWAAGAGTVAAITAAYESWEAFCDEIRLLGKKLVVTTELPNGNIDCNGTAFTGYLATRGGTKNWYWLNDKIRAYALRYSDSVYLIDFANIYLDTNPANPVWPDNATTYTTNAGSTQKLTDGIHPTAAGAQIIAQKVAAFISANFPAIDHFGNGAGSAYDKDPNPANYGTAGTAGAGTTGSVATSLTLTPQGGTAAAIAASKVARSDLSGAWQRAEYSATVGDNCDLTWYKSAAASGMAVGNIMQLISEIKVAANPTALNRISAMGRIYGAANPQWMRVGQSTSGDAELGQFITAETTFTMRSPGFVVNAGFSGVSVYVDVIARGITAAFTVDYGRRVLRELNTPVLA